MKNSGLVDANEGDGVDAAGAHCVGAGSVQPQVGGGRASGKGVHWSLRDVGEARVLGQRLATAVLNSHEKSTGSTPSSSQRGEPFCSKFVDARHRLKVALQVEDGPTPRARGYDADLIGEW